MKKITLLYSIIMLLVIGCGQSYEEQQRISRAERIRLAKEDSAALKIAVAPTMDCLPLYVAKDEMLFDTAKADIRLKFFTSHIDGEAALLKGRVEGMVSDLVRCERVKSLNIPLRYVTSTNLSWQLFANRKSRIKSVSQLGDKLVAMTRFSALDMFTDRLVDSAKIKSDFVLRIQINDPNVRFQMLQNNELDAIFFPEPQATGARMYKNPVLADTEKMDIRMGVIAFRGNILDGNRQKQLEEFVAGYNRAVDEINKNGVKHYAGIIKKYMKVDGRVVSRLPDITFKKMEPPRLKDVEMASEYWKKKQLTDNARNI
jgi:NitT/TauT family transport system substrate-binding protein